MNVVKELKKLETDKEKWRFLLENKEENYVVILDNDETYVQHEADRDYDSFSYYIGSAEGVGELLDVLGINWDYC